MRRRRPLVPLLAGLAVAAGTLVPGAAAAPLPDDLHQRCLAAGVPPPVCTALERADADIGGVTGLGAPPADIRDWQRTWAHEALGLQRALGDRLPLDDSEWVATHNSYNAAAYQPPTVSGLDPNQRYGIGDQLRMDVRSVELDVHWFPSVTAGGAPAPILCHATGPHVGCTWERPLSAGLAEIAAWLAEPANAGEVVMIDVEDHLDVEAGYETAAAAIEAALGPLLYRPPGGGCHPMPLDVSRDGIRATGARVIVTSGCGLGASWPRLAWSTDGRRQSAFTGTDPACGPLGPPSPGDGAFLRHWEDSTFVSSLASPGLRPITPGDAADLLRCGVNMVSLDMLVPFDGRLEAMVWSWAPGEPRVTVPGSRCAAFGGRMAVAPCRVALPAACRDAAGEWSVSDALVAHRSADRTCRWEGRGTSAVPASAVDSAALGAVTGQRAVWVDYRVVDGTWTPEAAG